MNFRADRARQLTEAFVSEQFGGFDRKRRPKLAQFTTLTQYAESLRVPCAFPPATLTNSLGEYISDLGFKQLRIAETEKFAHVTFFFSCGREQPYPLEDRILVPSPDVATYDLAPSMSAPEVTRRLCDAIRQGDYKLIVCNFANGDMVGHTGNLSAAIQAVEALDQCLSKVVAASRSAGGQILITADHGNCEQMTDNASGQPHTAHTSSNPHFFCVVVCSRLRAALRLGESAHYVANFCNVCGLCGDLHRCSQTAHTTEHRDRWCIGCHAAGFRLGGHGQRCGS